MLYNIGNIETAQERSFTGGLLQGFSNSKGGMTGTLEQQQNPTFI